MEAVEGLFAAGADCALGGALGRPPPGDSFAVGVPPKLMGRVRAGLAPAGDAAPAGSLCMGNSAIKRSRV